MDNVGEITGEVFEENDFDRGLPMRPKSMSAKLSQEDKPFDMTTRFDVFTQPITNNVKSYDPDNNYADINESSRSLTSQLKPTNICGDGISSLTNTIFNNMGNIGRVKSFVNGYGLYTLAAGLFVSSKGITEIELKKYFAFPSKEILTEGLTQYDYILTNISFVNSIITFNTMIVGDVPVNLNYFGKKLRKFASLIQAGNNASYEAARINTIINNQLTRFMPGIKTRKHVNPVNIEKLQLMLVSSTIIRPVWSISFDLKRGPFTHTIFDQGVFKTHTTEHKYLVTHNKTFDYYESQECRILEVPFLCKIPKHALSFGFIIVPSLNTSIDIPDLTKQLRPYMIKKVQLPSFEYDYKIRFNSVLKKTGLVTLFEYIESSKLFPKKTVLHDVIQNTKIIVKDFGIETDNQPTSNKVKNHFVINKSFIFYIRHKTSNTILFTGTY